MHIYTSSKLEQLKKNLVFLWSRGGSLEHPGIIHADEGKILKNIMVSETEPRTFFLGTSIIFLLLLFNAFTK